MNKIALTFSAITLVFSVSAQNTEIRQAIRITDNEQFEKATSVYKTLIAKDPQDAETYFYFGENLFAAENLDSAEVLYKQGISVNPEFPLNHIGLAKVQRVRGKMTEAQASMDAAFNLFNQKGVKIKDELKVRTYVEAGEALLEGSPKNTTKALDYAGKALAIDENSVGAHIVRGDALFEADPLNATEPLSEYKKAAELDKTSAKALARAAYMYYRGRIYRSAIQYYTDALKIDANFAPAYSGRGDAYYYNNQPQEAIKDYQRYLELNAGNITARKRYIGFLIVLKKHDEAMSEISLLEKQIGKEDPILNRLKGYVLYEKGDYKGALDALTFFINHYQADKINATDYEYMGRINQKLGNLDEMAMYFNRAVTMDYKTKSGLLDEMISVYREKKDDAKQADLYNRKIKLGSKDANDYYYGGGAALRAEKYGMADTMLTAYVQVMPDFAPAWLMLAQAKDGSDTLEVKLWTAKDAYSTYLTKLKPEDIDRNKTRIAEAYYYLARYFYISDKKDLAVSKCWATKMAALNASEFWNKTAENFLKQKDIAAATAAAECQP